MNIREISDVFKDTTGDIEALKSYNFGWASDRVRQGNTEDFQELNTFPRVFFSVPTITASDQIRKQDTYQVTLFFDDLLGYDNEGDADLTLQIDKWAALQQYATAFIQRLNLIKQTILPNYLFIPEPPQFTFDSFVGIQRLVTVQVNFNLVVPTNCEVTVKRVIELVGNAIARGTSQANIFLSTSVSAFVECKATATGFIVTGQQNIIEVDASVTAFALASGDIVRVQNVSATSIATATSQAEVQRAVNIIGELNATGQVSGNINLTLFATGSATGTANVSANLEVTTKGVVECEANVTGTAEAIGSLFVIRTLEAQSIGEATSQSQIILSKLLSGVASGFAVAEANINLGLKFDASVQATATSEANLDVTTQNVVTLDAFITATATSEANIQRVISIESSIDTTVTTSAEAQITRVLNAEATATANTEASAQITIPVTATATATAESSAEANLSYSVNASATATAESSADAQITRVISATALATANSSADVNFGITLNAGITGEAKVINANALRSVTLTASVTGAATVTNSNLQLFDPNFANVSILLHGTGTNGQTTFTDSSQNNLTLTRSGNTIISTSRFKFNTSSILLPQTATDVLNIANSGTLFQFTGNFTIEAFINLDTNSFDKSLYIISNTSVTFFFALNIDSSNFNIYLNNATPTTITHGMSVDIWYHVAMVRSGSTITLYVNGVSKGTITNSATLGFASGSSSLNRLGGGVSDAMYIDEFRITKGIARYTTGFTPPSREFLDQ
jgi:hypothetical protein